MYSIVDAPLNNLHRWLSNPVASSYFIRFLRACCTFLVLSNQSLQLVSLFRCVHSIIHVSTLSYTGNNGGASGTYQ